MNFVHTFMPILHQKMRRSLFDIIKTYFVVLNIVLTFSLYSLSTEEKKTRKFDFRVLEPKRINEITFNNFPKVQIRKIGY